MFSGAGWGKLYAYLINNHIDQATIEMCHYKYTQDTSGSLDVDFHEYQRHQQHQQQQ